MLAKCNYCAKSCLKLTLHQNYFTLNGKQYPRIRVGDKYDLSRNNEQVS